MACVGCWSEPATKDGFTPKQWAVLQQQLHYTPPAPGPWGPATFLGSELFQDPRLSRTGAVSCQTCHDPTYAWIDSRTPDNVSLGVATADGCIPARGAWTKRNAMTLYNVCEKQMLGGPFTWSGAYSSPGQVLELAIKKPFGWCTFQDGAAAVANLIRTDGSYWMLYNAAFGAVSTDDTDVIHHLDKAFDAYFCTSAFISPISQFDLWLQDQPSTMSDSAQRGFAVFVGRGTCIECHSGPLFSDFQFHDTGVPQVGDHVPAVDNGRADVTMDPADTGKFLTGTLREIANTGPYMHDGAFATLADVIDFYRHGGVASGYGGTRDPRIVPLDLTDGDAQDLEAFLRSISCDDPACGVLNAPPPPPPPPDAGYPPPPDVGPPPPDALMCPVPLTSCGPLCVDTQTDPMNCGTCGNMCTASKPNCVMGSCVH